ncbi:MAG: hypothetical protein U0169_20835 [Polyangiaceae bacterium]
MRKGGASNDRAFVFATVILAAGSSAGCTRRDGTAANGSTPTPSTVGTASAAEAASRIGPTDAPRDGGKRPDPPAPPTRAEDLVRGTGATALEVAAQDPGKVFDDALRERLTDPDRYTPDAKVISDRTSTSPVDALDGVFRTDPSFRRCLTAALPAGSKTERVVRFRFKLDATARPTGGTFSSSTGALSPTAVTCLGKALHDAWFPLPVGTTPVAYDSAGTTAQPDFTKATYDFDVRFVAKP